MKKSLIAAAGATLAVSAMPVLGVFAEGEGTFTDSVTITVAESCVFRTSGASSEVFDGQNRSFSKTNVAPGTVVNFASGDAATGNAPAIELYCNGNPSIDKTYTINAKGNQTTTDGNEMVGTSSNINTSSTWATTGPNSVWQMSIDGGSSYIDVPAKTGRDVVTSQTITPGTAVTFNPKYRVYVGTSQAAGTYEGKVLYTLSIGV